MSVKGKVCSKDSSSNFPATYKVGIFIQFLMEITETVSRQIYIFHYALNQMEVTDNCVQLIFRVQTIQKCQHCQLSIYYGELDYSCMGIDGPYK